ncbi:amidohydrolase [Flavobacterium sp.]|uniref:amidohydrolase n=1 Tax=Flavobacterium sp. TaxID=239 RepID=UPI002602FCCD|nr:amidohydrolase [Flavobacterium sp.]MDD2986107.1 amidohydrolase [Flavobacterium sp.]
MENLNNRMESLIRLRKELHKNPELSGKEQQTSERILAFLEKHKPDECHTQIGKTGIIAIYHGEEEGKTLLFRCELDALPIKELNNFEHQSVHKGVAHSCGHDGHMAILCGLATVLAQKKLARGKVILLFQPSEENGKGAAKVMKNEFFKTLQPDFVFALHNLPNFPKNQIVVKENAFTCAVVSLKIMLQGKTAHAGEPENGINPAVAMAEITQQFHTLNQPNLQQNDFTLVTPIFSSMGKKAYGVSAGNAEVHFTIRCKNNAGIKELQKILVEKVNAVSKLHQLKYSVKWIEPFYANENNPAAVQLIADATKKLGYNLLKKETPFRWGEDFGLFTAHYAGALFGLGAGLETPDLHNPDYDFPDEIIATGIKVFYQICKDLNDA